MSMVEIILDSIKEVSFIEFLKTVFEGIIFLVFIVVLFSCIYVLG